METNIPTLYILKRDSFVVKMPKFQLFYALLSKILKKKQCCHGSHDANK